MGEMEIPNSRFRPLVPCPKAGAVTGQIKQHNHTADGHLFQMFHDDTVSLNAANKYDYKVTNK